MLLPANKRRKTITVKDVEAVVAMIARIPPKSVSRDDKKLLQSLLLKSQKKMVIMKILQRMKLEIK